MSGNAALSAARKRRASSSPMGAGGGAQSSAQSSAYYSRTTPTAQQLMNQPFPEHNPPPQYTLPHESSPNVPINIYENIELIKQQIAARTKAIQTQGNTIPPDKLRILQKQNEIQTQILKQKMAIAQQMEQAEQQQQGLREQQRQQQLAQMAIPSMDEPEFIYEKGIPRKNPKYKTPAEIEAMKQARAQAHAHAHAHAYAPAQSRGPVPPRTQSQMTPFVSMINETGVFPPPIVILKSHDAKLEEHDNVIQDILQQLDYLHSSSASSAPNLPAIKEENNSKKDVAEDPESDADEEQELLMEVVMRDLTDSREFIEGIVDKIVNDTNLSDVIMKIEPLVKENQELRSLIYSQQQMMNEMNTMLLRLLNTSGSSTAMTSPEPNEPIVFQDNGLDGDGLYQPEMTEIVLSNSETAVIADPDTESAHIIDEAPAEETVAVAVVAVATVATTPKDEEEEEEAVPEEEEEAGDEEHSEMPHFPEQISLVVNEI